LLFYLLSLDVIGWTFASDTHWIINWRGWIIARGCPSSAANVVAWGVWRVASFRCASDSVLGGLAWNWTTRGCTSWGVAILGGVGIVGDAVRRVRGRVVGLDGVVARAYRATCST